MDYTYRLDAKRIFVAGVLDLRNQDAVHRWMTETTPDAVVLAAAKVGGILANDRYPADFLLDNLLIEANVIRRRRGHNPARRNDDLPASEAPKTTSARSAPASRMSRSRSRARRT